MFPELSSSVILTYLHPADQKAVLTLFGLFQRVDLETSEFSRATGLSCLEGCGHCCENPDIETTVLEVLPLAIYLWETKTAAAWLERLTSRKGRSLCVLYHPAPGGGGKGRCGAYSLRPGICRLFGFSAVRDKHARCVLATCGAIKQSQPRGVSDAQERISSGLKVPVLSDLALQVFQIDPLRGRESLPINAALRTALEYVGTLVDLKGTA